MRKILFFIILVISFFITTTDVFAAYEDKYSSKPQFIVTSDIHLGFENQPIVGKKTYNQDVGVCNGAQAWNWSANEVLTNQTLFSRFLANSNFNLKSAKRRLLVVGDMTELGAKTHHDNYKRLIKGYNVITSVGNHEFQVYRGSSDNDMSAHLEPYGISKNGRTQYELVEPYYTAQRNEFLNSKYNNTDGQINSGQVVNIDGYKVRIITVGTNYTHTPSWSCNNPNSSSYNDCADNGIYWGYAYRYNTSEKEFILNANNKVQLYDKNHTYVGSDQPYRNPWLYAYIKDEDYTNIIDKQLKAAQNAGEIAIVMSHWPANDTVYAGYHDHLRTNLRTINNTLNNTIAKYPNAIVVSGHYHNYFINVKSKKNAKNVTERGIYRNYPTSTNPESHSIYFHDGTGIKGSCTQKCLDAGVGTCGKAGDSKITGVDFLKITIINQKSARIEQLNVTNGANAAIRQPSGYKTVDWSWYKTTYNANGGSGTNPGTTWGFETIAANPFTKTGYKFTGWNTKKDGSGVAKTSSNKASHTANETLYAQWSPHVLKITYNMNGGSLSTEHGSTIGTSGSDITINGNIATQVGTYGGKISSDGLANYNNKDYINIVRKGYKAKSGAEWNSKSDGTGTSHNQATQYNVSRFADLSTSDKTVKLYVNWEVVPYSITYTLGGGTATNPTSYNITTPTFTLTNPTKSGYEFTGWTGSNGSTPQKTVTITKGSTGNKTYTANWKRINYTITYQLNGGTVASNPTTYNKDTSTFTLNNPTKDGYEFIGWTGSNGSTPQKTVTITKGSTGNKTYTANYQAKSYTISFNSNGGSNVSSITKPYGDAVTAPTNPTKDGYNFSGWYSNTGLTTQYEFTTMPKENITLYAKWTPKNYTISFESNGGSSVASITKPYGEAVTAPTDPTREDYRFAGWYSDSTLTTLYSFTTMPKENITLYAKWITGEKLISYKLDGGINNPTNPTSYTPGNEINLGDATKDGYTFAGWYRDSSLTNRVNKITSDMTGDITLYAKWTAKSYTISFNSNGGSNVSSITKPYGDAVAAPSNPSKEGYSFGGWYSDSDLTIPYEFTTMPKENITLYAKWINNTVIVNFETNGGTTLDEITIEKGSRISAIQTVEKLGYTFKGWYKDRALTQAFSIEEAIMQDMTLYAKWQINKYTVTYESNGGSSVPSETVEYNKKANEPETPTKKGYTFSGWYKDVILVTGYDFDEAIDHDMTLYAKWEANSYTISFDSNGGSDVAAITRDYESVVTKPASPTKEGYTFAGWYKDEELTQLYSFTTMPAENITLYAKWTSNEYVITYEANGGVMPGDAKTSYRTGEVVPLKIPTRNGYSFRGWFTEPELINEIEEIGDGSKENVTVYASWEQQDYTITYEVDGEIIETQMAATGDILDLPVPSETGYSFSGWYIDEEMTTLYNYAKRVASDDHLYGSLIRNRYTINFNSNGGSKVNSINELYDSGVVAPNPPYKAGYKFAGWYTDAKLTQLYSFTTMPATNITLYAKWIPNTEYVIKYVTNGGINDSSNPTQYKYGENKRLKSATRKGFEFIGWYTKSGKKVTSTKNMKGDLTLYAKWKSRMMYSPNTANNKFILIAFIEVSLLFLIGNLIFMKFNNKPFREDK